MDRPPREFAGAAAVELAPGASETVTLDPDEPAIGRLTVDDGWTVHDGEHVVRVGRSSRDLRASVSIDR